MAQEQQLSANIINDSGNALMSIKSLSRDGDRVKIRGSLLGQWDTDMYMEPDQLVNAIQIALNSPELIAYVLDLPDVLKAALSKKE
jgi:hypothetical protein